MCITVHRYPRHPFKSASVPQVFPPRYTSRKSDRAACWPPSSSAPSFPLLPFLSSRSTILLSRCSRPLHVHVRCALLHQQQQQPVGSLARAFAQAAAIFLFSFFSFFCFLHRSTRALALFGRTCANEHVVQRRARCKRKERERENERTREKRRHERRAHKHEHVSVSGMRQERKKVKGWKRARGVRATTERGSQSMERRRSSSECEEEERSKERK